MQEIFTCVSEPLHQLIRQQILLLKNEGNNDVNKQHKKNNLILLHQFTIHSEIGPYLLL